MSTIKDLLQQQAGADVINTAALPKVASTFSSSTCCWTQNSSRLNRYERTRATDTGADACLEYDRMHPTLETASSRGKLRLFFGYAAGVGKTYAMLQAAQAMKREGRDVIIGYVEPHARPETQALTEGLEGLAAIGSFLSRFSTARVRFGCDTWLVSLILSWWMSLPIRMHLGVVMQSVGKMSKNCSRLGSMYFQH
jgi:hypothetical protein